MSHLYGLPTNRQSGFVNTSLIRANPRDLASFGVCRHLGTIWPEYRKWSFLRFWNIHDFTSGDEYATTP